MEYSTPNAIRQIKSHKEKAIIVEGQKTCPLEAMSFALNYHVLDITETDAAMMVTGVQAVTRIQRFVIK